MKVRFSFSIVVILILNGAYAQGDPSSYAFSDGELIEYKLNFGWFSIGKGSFELGSKEGLYKGDECYEVRIKGGSSGFFKRVYKSE